MVIRSLFFLEETGLRYDVIPVNIGRGDQLKSAFLTISPNNRIPAIIDDSPDDGGEPLSVFESGAFFNTWLKRADYFSPVNPEHESWPWNGCIGKSVGLVQC